MWQAGQEVCQWRHCTVGSQKSFHFIASYVGWPLLSLQQQKRVIKKLSEKSSSNSGTKPASLLVWQLPQVGGTTSTNLTLHINGGAANGSGNSRRRVSGGGDVFFFYTYLLLFAHLLAFGFLFSVSIVFFFFSFSYK